MSTVSSTANSQFNSVPTEKAEPRQTPSIKAMIGVCVAGACAFLNLYATQPLLPFLVQYFHTSKANASMTVSATALAVAFSAPLIGTVADRIGRKRIVVPAIFLLSVPTIVAALSSNLVELTICRFFQGFILPAVFAISMVYVTEEWDESGVGSAMATYISGNVIGGFIGRYIAGITADSFGWRWSFVALAVCTVLGGVLAWWLLPPSRVNNRTSTEPGTIWSAIPFHLTNPKLLVTFGVGSMVLFSIVAAFTYINYRLAAAPYNFSPGALSTLFSVYLVGAFITPFAGKLIDKLGFRIAYAMAISTSLLGLLLTLSPSIPVVVAGLTIFSTGIFVCQSSTTSSLRVFAPTRRSTAAGLYVCFYYLGGSLGGYLPGLFWDAGGWNYCVAIIAAAQILALVVAWFFWKPARGMDCRLLNRSAM